MIQTGDPTGTGRGGTSIYGNKLYVCGLPSAMTLDRAEFSPQRGRNQFRAQVHRSGYPSHGELWTEYQW